MRVESSPAIASSPACTLSVRSAPPVTNRTRYCLTSERITAFKQFSIVFGDGHHDRSHLGRVPPTGLLHATTAAARQRSEQLVSLAPKTLPAAGGGKNRGDRTGAQGRRSGY